MICIYFHIVIQCCLFCSFYPDWQLIRTWRCWHVLRWKDILNPVLAQTVAFNHPCKSCSSNYLRLLEWVVPRLAGFLQRTAKQGGPLLLKRTNIFRRTVRVHFQRAKLQRTLNKETGFIFYQFVSFYRDAKPVCDGQMPLPILPLLVNMILWWIRQKYCWGGKII